eukprot:9466925-Pyramimonas_sp.AAC.1
MGGAGGRAGGGGAPGQLGIPGRARHDGIGGQTGTSGHRLDASTCARPTQWSVSRTRASASAACIPRRGPPVVASIQHKPSSLNGYGKV